MEQKISLHYSTAFKQKVISEIESGKLSISQARKLYGIGGGSIIQKWIKKFGKLHLLNKIVRVELKGEESKLAKLKELEKQKKELESALAQAHLKILYYESLIEVTQEELGVDIKKNLNTKLLTGQRKKQIKKGRKQN